MGVFGRGSVRLRAEHKDHIWSYDFVQGRTNEGRSFRMLTVIDEHTRECLAIDVARNLRSDDVLGLRGFTISSSRQRANIITLITSASPQYTTLTWPTEYHDVCHADLIQRSLSSPALHASSSLSRSDFSELRIRSLNRKSREESISLPTSDRHSSTLAKTSVKQPPRSSSPL